MSRRRLTQPDSLELLLDTMCNTFGGIILIALLIALFARDVPARVDTASASAESAEVLARRFTKAQEELAQARRLRDELTARESDPSLTERVALARLREQLRQQRESLQEQAGATRTNQASADPVTRLRELNAQWRAAEVEQAEQTNLRETLKEQLETTKKKNRDAEAQIEEERRRQVRTLRLPREHSTEKTPWEIIVRYGRVYPVHFSRGGEKDVNIATITWVRQGEDSQVVEPKRGAGLDPLATPGAWTNFVKSVSAQNYYLSFRVYEDSFGAFNQAKEIALANGFEFGWAPLQNSAKIYAGRGGAAPPPQ